MVTTIAPPTPPKALLSPEKHLEIYQQMQSDLEATVRYQEESIEYHQKSLTALQQEVEVTKAQLQLCNTTIASITKTQQLVPEISKADGTASSNGNYPAQVEKSESEPKSEVETATKTETQTDSKSTKNKGKSGKPTSTKKAKTPTKSQTPAKPKSTKSKTQKQEQKKPQTKATNSLPPSDKLNQFESITAMIIDFMSKQPGVIEVADVIKYVYPDGLDEAQYKKVSSSFSSVLGIQSKKGFLERTVPGKYRWIGQK
jgi:hypothetical protein